MTVRDRHLRNMRRLSLAGGVLSAQVWRQIRRLNEASVDELTELASAALQPVADRAAAQSAAFLAYRTGQPIPTPTPAALAVDWRSPFTVAWKALGDGKGIDEALTAGESVTDALGRSAVTSAARRAGDNLDQSNIVGWRRVLFGDTCDWCVELTSYTFPTAAAADFGHVRCDCGVDPIMR